jgi:pyruvate kinase
MKEPNPNRNEASDIGYSVLDGIDAVVLHETTSEGMYPDLTCAAISRCIVEAEKTVDYK